ncbi:hypothetical protein GM661_04645 [Iocasia frigidifontis]|uniref:Uncharacterized protein n=1 Tax=Iocasia fonsfrigidae TaxID=2682810 RepID=A0A8A7KHG7_9FIRM|nr:hypothetical protein [Iocasia fonsfrigidae]QTL97322.1 hypothetical protein GM661_04645 [Iocasia fonsfrigidae]
MTQTDKSKQKQVIIIAAVVLIAPVIIGLLVNLGSHDIEDVRIKMEEYLYDRYGEEFVVDRIGTRSGYYEARIYPKSIIGTSKEDDSYYYSQAGIKIERKLGNVGDGYDIVLLNIEGEEYLKPKAREMFGDKIKLKTKIRYKKKKEGNDYFSWQIRSGFKELLKKSVNNSETHRIELQLFIYIFDRIETEEEKEERRREIFEFVQYLKEEGLYKYLELGVIFIDERVLAPGYGEYSLEVRFSDKEKVEIGGKKVYLPPLELRKEMTVKLQEEIDKMSEEELLERMGRIKKSRLDDLRGYNTQCGTFIYSWGMLEENYSSSLSRRDKSRNYSKLEHVELDNGLKYMYLSRKE